MLFTHHSHSGQFCTHADSTLEQVVKAAVAKGMTSICLTEHIPRHSIDYYPGEDDHPLLAHGTDLFAVFAAYHAEASRLRSAYAHQIDILVGFESEWIRSQDTASIITSLQAEYHFDLFIGSVHHVLGIPTDFTDEDYARARDAAGGTDEDIAIAYFDAQLEMLETLRPPVIGHFDLIRLKADVSNRDRDWTTWGEGLWTRILRNLRVVKQQGGVLEVNSAALRKGLADVYPRREIMRAWTEMGGRLTLSDDSHGVGQLCTNYAKALDCVRAAGVEELWYAVKSASGVDWKPVALQKIYDSLARVEAQ